MSKSVYTEKSDIYSLGILAYEILAETTAYGDMGGFDLINNVVNKHFRPDLSILRQNFKPQVIELISACLHQRPDLRPSAGSICRSMIKILKKSK